MPGNPSIAGKSQKTALTSTPSPLRPQKWSGTNRVTVLLTGIDYRVNMTCEDQGTASRTDSIPRDLWVDIPSYGSDTINTANFSGDAYGYPGGGPALAVKTVEANFGVKVDYYIRLDFGATTTNAG